MSHIDLINGKIFMQEEMIYMKLLKTIMKTTFKYGSESKQLKLFQKKIFSFDSDNFKIH